MYGHFSVILLCFTGVYCLSKIENLNLDGLKEICSGQTTIKEWETAMDQNIFYNDNNRKTTVNVKRAVDEFIQKANNGDETGFERIRNIIITAYQCTLTKYGSLIAYLTVQDMRALKDTINTTIRFMIKNQVAFDRQNIMKNLSFQKYFKQASGKQYHSDFDFKFRGWQILLLSKHDFENTPSREWHNVWARIIKKQNVGVKIKYKIYPDVFQKNFTNQFDLPDVHSLNEIICVLNEAIQVFDKFILDNCVQHDGSFLKNFQSLKEGINNDVIQLTNYIDNKIAAGLPYWALYTDYSTSGARTSQADNEIIGSGGFVENVEFEISGLKMDLPNTKKPTEIYGHHDNERTSQTILKFYETMNFFTNGQKISMVMVCDPESLLIEQDKKTIRIVYIE